MPKVNLQFPILYKEQRPVFEKTYFIEETRPKKFYPVMTLLSHQENTKN